MPSSNPTVIQIHLTTGRKHLFYQANSGLIQNICDDLEGQVFKRPSLNIESINHVTTFPGQAMIGITILADPIPDCFYERERLTKAIVTQISAEAFQLRRLKYIAKVEGERGKTISELEFVSGERLYLEFNEVAGNSIDERNLMHHLFSNPSLCCRRLEGGFSIWNTAQIVSWSHYPKLEVPVNAWQAESLAELATADTIEPAML